MKTNLFFYWILGQFPAICHTKTRSKFPSPGPTEQNQTSSPVLGQRRIQWAKLMDGVTYKDGSGSSTDS